MNMKILTLLLLIVSCRAEWDLESKWQFPQQDNSCRENDANCLECLRQKSCSWCGADTGPSSCIPSDSCPDDLQHSSCPYSQQDLEDQIENLDYENRQKMKHVEHKKQEQVQYLHHDRNPEQTKHINRGKQEQLQNLHDGYRHQFKHGDQDKRVIVDVPQVTLNATYLCHLRRNCTTCTNAGFCAWCAEKKDCVPYLGSSTTTLCGGKSWSRSHCISKGALAGVKPCPHRTSGCKECLADKHCYWCGSTQSCDYYRGDGIKPANCTSGDWYYQQCYNHKAIIVLLPIIIIIATPIIAYIVMYCILCAMKEAGYDVLDDSESSDDEDKIRKPIMLKHDSPGNKTDNLRKKYGLDKKP